MYFYPRAQNYGHIDGMNINVIVFSPKVATSHVATLDEKKVKDSQDRGGHFEVPEIKTSYGDKADPKAYCIKLYYQGEL